MDRKREFRLPLLAVDSAYQDEGSKKTASYVSNRSGSPKGTFAIKEIQPRTETIALTAAPMTAREFHQ